MIAFVIIAAAVFFLVIKPVNALMARMKRGEEAPPEGPPEDVILLREIRDALTARGGGAGPGSV